MDLSEGRLWYPCVHTFEYLKEQEAVSVFLLPMIWHSSLWGPRKFLSPVILKEQVVLRELEKGGSLVHMSHQTVWLPERSLSMFAGTWQSKWLSSMWYSLCSCCRHCKLLAHNILSLILHLSLFTHQDVLTPLYRVSSGSLCLERFTMPSKQK